MRQKILQISALAIISSGTFGGMAGISEARASYIMEAWGSCWLNPSEKGGATLTSVFLSKEDCQRNGDSYVQSAQRLIDGNNPSQCQKNRPNGTASYTVEGFVCKFETNRQRVY